MTKRKIFTLVALFVLLAVRILVVDPVSNLEQLFSISNPLFLEELLRVIRDLNSYLLISWSYLLIGIVLVVNRSDLHSLNVDGGLVFLYILCGLSYFKYFPWPSGWLVLLLSAAIFILYKKEAFTPTNLQLSAWRTMTLVLIIFFLVLLPIFDLLQLSKTSSIIELIVYGAPFVLLEEMLFRGLLWKFLDNLNLPTFLILSLQAFLFWVSHINNMIADPIFFWLLMPIMSIILGIIVWRSKSLTVSFIAHILINFLLGFR